MTLAILCLFQYNYPFNKRWQRPESAKELSLTALSERGI